MVRRLTIFAFGGLCAALLMGQSNPGLRQRCYAIGLAHAQDPTDPAVLGIAPGDCRESYDAGRAFVIAQQRQSAEIRRQACEEARAIVAKYPSMTLPAACVGQ